MNVDEHEVRPSPSDPTPAPVEPSETSLRQNFSVFLSTLKTELAVAFELTSDILLHPGILKFLAYLKQEHGILDDSTLWSDMTLKSFNSYVKKASSITNFELIITLSSAFKTFKSMPIPSTTGKFKLTMSVLF